ncbi:hypothetical protein Scep_014746 [Stephania cephalantha]|uniref:Uncharacterized protein n=1 Tax=Stephania cephalantha TaxID=152367 RepID=A0AAP0J2K9_9MAGN
MEILALHSKSIGGAKVGIEAQGSAAGSKKVCSTAHWALRLQAWHQVGRWGAMVEKLLKCGVVGVGLALGRQVGRYG